MKTAMGGMPRLRWWWPLRKHLARVLLAGIPVAVAAVILALLVEPVFESRALVEVQPPFQSPVPGVNPATTDLQFTNALFMNTQREILGSVAVAGVYREQLRVNRVADTHLLAVHYRSTDPVQARNGANTVAQAYVDHTTALQVAEIQRAASLLIQKLESVIQAPALRLQDVGSTSSEALFGEILPPLTPLVSGLENVQLPELPGTETLGYLLESVLIRQIVESYDNSLMPMVSARIMDLAPLPEEPVGRAYPFWVVLSYLSAVAVPAVVLVARFQLRDTFSFPQDVERELGQPCLGSLPLVQGADSTRLQADRQFAAAVRSLRTTLHTLRPPEQPLEQFPRGRTVLVTSGLTGEGKSTVAVSLALALGRMERVLLIDADMRTSRSCLGIAAGAPGLSHLIAGAAQMRDCIHSVADGGIDVIPAGVLPPNPQELLAGKRFRKVLEMLERRYDTIIVDGPAVAEVSDTVLLARHCSDLVYVVAAAQTKILEARTYLAQLLNRGLLVSGVVLNRTASVEKAGHAPLQRGEVA